MIYFISDTHFGHSNIIKYCNRPFSSIEEMDECLIDNWNSVVKDKDEIYHLGDFSLSKNKEYLKSIVKRLKGKKHLVKGNHDYLKDGEYCSLGFQSVQYYKELKWNKRKFCLMHFPLLSWNKMHRGSYMVHGHCHGTINHLNLGITRIDVGVDNFNYTPVSIEEVENLLKDNKPSVVNHHS